MFLYALAMVIVLFAVAYVAATATGGLTGFVLDVVKTFAGM